MNLFLLLFSSLYLVNNVVSQTTGTHETIEEVLKDEFPREINIYKEFMISFEHSEIAKQKLTKIFTDNGLSLHILLRYPDPFEAFYVTNLSINSYHPACPVCSKSFRSREYLHLHVVRKHLPEILDVSKRYTIFSEACEFMQCYEKQNIQEEMGQLNLQRCMRYLDEYFKLEDRSQTYKLCKAIVTNEYFESSKESVISQIFSWLFFIVFAIVTFIYLIYVVDAHLSEKKSVFINLD